LRIVCCLMDGLYLSIVFTSSVSSGRDPNLSARRGIIVVQPRRNGGILDVLAEMAK
jgi:hypothetical protein